MQNRHSASACLFTRLRDENVWAKNQFDGQLLDLTTSQIVVFIASCETKLDGQLLSLTENY
tara:strand:+ start:413 stop:595 length:183 start_codon:yes stop_codon:yes gene_type:complete